jgi:hypothetical protein
MGFRGGVMATVGAERTLEVVKDRWAAAHAGVDARSADAKMVDDRCIVVVVVVGCHGLFLAGNLSRAESMAVATDDSLLLVVAIEGC